MEEYAKHVPRILTRQILKRVIEDYINSIETKDDTPTTESQDVNSDSNKSKSSLMASTKCSIARFYGSLLFVDISGFTKLSQRLNVDELRQNINAYFKKILDIVFRYKGDVVKFAGDALFIIWQTDVVDTG